VDREIIDQPSASTGEPQAAPPPARVIVNGQVTVGNIPAPRPGLQPRPALLTRLNQASQGPPAAVLTGPWGAGKTELAATYARARLASGWRLIAWINAQDSQSLLAGLAAVAEATGLCAADSSSGAAEAGRLVRHWLEADGSRCLLVFDGAQDAALLRPFVPAQGPARVLITVGREPVAELGPGIPVDVFSAEEALAVLDGRTGLADETGAAAVAAELAHLPLALDLAAVVIAGQRLGYAEYLARLQALRTGNDLAREQDAPEGTTTQPYPHGVAEAVLLALEAAYAADRLGVCTAVMELMAMLSPVAVRRDLLRAAGQAGTLLGRGRKVATAMVDQALERLNERSLLGFSLDGQVVTVHGLVARVAREQAARHGRGAAACRAGASVLELSAAARARTGGYEAVTEALGQFTALLENSRGLAADGGAMPGVAAMGEPLAAELERLLGSGHPDTIRAQHDLARACREAGRVAEAVPLLERALATEEQLLGARHPSTLTSRNNLGSAYRATGRAAEAIPLFEQNVAACEELLGADDPKTLASRQSLELARGESAQTARRD